MTKQGTELKAYRLPSDVCAAIKERAGGVRSETDVVIELLRLGLAGNVGKVAKRVVIEAQARKASDPLASVVERDDIDYTKPDELPSGGSVAYLDATGPSVASGKGKVAMASWRAGRKPLLKPGEKK